MAVNEVGDMRTNEELELMAIRIRRRILDMSLHCEGPTHLGGGLSIVEILAVLYGRVMSYRSDDPHWDDRDRFILSKGHGVLGYFSVLAEIGTISEETFRSFKTNGSALIAHPVMNLDLGIESSNGSLGQGLSLAVGMGWAARRNGKKWSIYLVLGNGECNEGSVWEAAMSAAQFKLGNIVTVIDNNRYQSDGSTENVLSTLQLAEKWRSFGWNVREIDGHDVSELVMELTCERPPDRPTCIVAHTVKGKGIEFMEANNDWHHNRLTQAMYEKAVASLEAPS